MFVYASTDAKERQEQWNGLKARRQMREKNCVIWEGDFNDTKNQEEKKGEKRRQAGIFSDFKSFIADMEMGDIKFKEEAFTWANNRENESYIQERLDRFFRSAEWMVHFDKAEVKHIFRPASDDHMLLLDTSPVRKKTKSIFIFDSR